MKRIIFIIALVCNSIVAKAQEFKLSPYTQYLVDHPFVISPTFAGYSDEMNRLRISGVAQWIGLENAPLEQTISYDTRLNNEESGIGILLYNDRNGATKQIGGQLSYAHHLTLNTSNEQFLTFGISYKFNHFKINTENFHNGDPDIPVDDPAIGASQGVTNHNFEVGALYRIEEFFISINATNILNKRLKAFNSTEPVKLRNYYVYTGYTFYTENEEFEFEPSLYLNYYESDQRAESHLSFKARKITDDGYWWAGINGRFYNDQSFKFGSFAPMIGLKKDQFYFGCAYQWNVNEAKVLNGAGTPLITLGYDFEKNRGGSSWSRR